MQALLLCAGLGSRMKHLTKDKPKALVEVNGKPLLAWNLEKLKASGYTKVIINVHHFADQIISYLKEQDNFGLEIHISDERDQLLDTGGAVKLAMEFIDSDAPLLIHNVDIISDIDLRAMMQSHLEGDQLATLAVRTRKTTRYLMFEEETMHLTGWTNIVSKEIKLSRITTMMVTNYGFSGIHIIDADISRYYPSINSFSMIDVYLEAAKINNILAYPHEDDIWLDVGKPENIELAERALKKMG